MTESLKRSLLSGPGYARAQNKKNLSHIFHMLHHDRHTATTTAKTTTAVVRPMSARSIWWMASQKWHRLGMGSVGMGSVAHVQKLLTLQGSRTSPWEEKSVA